MLTKNRIPQLIALILCLEAVIYLWAYWSTEAEFVFNKCARNSARASAALILINLLMVGYYGLKRIYLDDKKRGAFQILMTLFAVNHLVHFFYVFLTFKNHSLVLDISDNKHGFITFIFIIIIPIVLWAYKNLNRLLYLVILLHLFNISYFINETFLSKIKPDKPAYHNKFGIVVISAALLYILYRIFRENKRSGIQNIPIITGENKNN